MDVPEDIDADRIHSQRLAHLDAVLPVGTRDTRIMNLSSFHRERFAIEQKRLVASSKGARLSGSIC